MICNISAACRLHKKAVKKLERRLQALAADHDAARQELLIKAAELLDMQAQLKEAEGRQQLQEDAACEQVHLTRVSAFEGFVSTATSQTARHAARCTAQEALCSCGCICLCTGGPPAHAGCTAAGAAGSSGSA